MLLQQYIRFLDLIFKILSKTFKLREPNPSWKCYCIWREGKESFHRVQLLTLSVRAVSLARSSCAPPPNRKQLTLSLEGKTVISKSGPHVWWQPGFIGFTQRITLGADRGNPTRYPRESVLHAQYPRHTEPTHPLPCQTGHLTACELRLQKVSIINGSCSTTGQSLLGLSFYYYYKNRKVIKEFVCILFISNLY